VTLSFHALEPARLADWLAFFDGPAFADNPDWGTCYCRYFLFEGGKDAWEVACATPGVNRTAMTALVRAGSVDGLLAYDGDRVIGWVHFGPTSRFKASGGALAPAEPDVASIVCFLVAAEHRRRGVARALLRAACDDLARRGFDSVDARPARDTQAEAMNQFTGPLPLYLAEGFEVVAEAKVRVRVRRSLRPTA
jgi:GNAT superfamily N-acetyltransferase